MAPLNRKINVAFGFGKYRSQSAFNGQATKVSADIAAYTLIFVTPDPAVSAVNADIASLAAAQILVETRAANGVATRNAAHNVVVSDMRGWERYVQSLIDAEPDPDQKMIIASSSGFDVKVNGVYAKPDLKITQLNTPGMVKLVGKAPAKTAAYEWQMSSNNGTTWITLPVSNSTKTTVSGLIAGTRYVFRYRSTVKNVTSGWCSPVSFIYTINP